MNREEFWAAFFDKKAKGEKESARRLCFSSEANQQSLYQAICSFVHGNFKTVLDVGAGDGELCLRLKERANLIVALDISFQMLRLAKGRISPGDSNIALCQASITHLPFSNSLFDLIVASEVLQYVPFLPAVSELIELLAVRGILAICIPHKTHPAIIKARKRRRGLYSGIDMDELHYLSKKEGISCWVQPLYLKNDSEKSYTQGPICKIPTVEANIGEANRLLIRIERLR